MARPPESPRIDDAVLETGGEGPVPTLHPDEAARLGATWNDLRQEPSEDAEVSDEEDSALAEMAQQLARERELDAAASSLNAPRPAAQPRQIFDQARQSLAGERRTEPPEARAAEVAEPAVQEPSMPAVEEPEEPVEPVEPEDEKEDHGLDVPAEEDEENVEPNHSESGVAEVLEAVRELDDAVGAAEAHESELRQRTSPTTAQPRRQVQPGRRRQGGANAVLADKARKEEARVVAASVKLKQEEYAARWAQEDKEAARANQAELQKLMDGVRSMREAHAADERAWGEAEAQARRQDEQVRRLCDDFAREDGEMELEELLRLHAEVAEYGGFDGGDDELEWSAAQLAEAAEAEERAWEQLRARAALEADVQAKARAQAEAREHAKAQARERAREESQAARRAALRGQPPPKAAGGRASQKTIAAYGGGGGGGGGGGHARTAVAQGSKSSLAAYASSMMGRSAPRPGRPPPTAPVQQAANSQPRLPQIRNNHTR